GDWQLKHHSLRNVGTPYLKDRLPSSRPERQNAQDANGGLNFEAFHGCNSVFERTPRSRSPTFLTFELSFLFVSKDARWNRAGLEHDAVAVFPNPHSNGICLPELKGFLAERDKEYGIIDRAVNESRSESSHDFTA